MITYLKSPYGINLLYRVHGSAVYKAILPGSISVLIYLFIKLIYRPHFDSADDIEHPYAVGVLVSSISFLIIFRANHGYQRYWESCSAIHQMMSKFLDAAVHAAAFHMQCDQYKKMKPPSFHDHPKLLLRRDISRDRKRSRQQQQEEEESTTQQQQHKIDTTSEDSDYRILTDDNSAVQPHDEIKKQNCKKSQIAPLDVTSSPDLLESEPKTLHSPHKETPSNSLQGRTRLDGGWGLLFENNSSSKKDDESSSSSSKTTSTTSSQTSSNYEHDDYNTPSLFLQELTHLSSLLVAVAFSTLRDETNDNNNNNNFDDTTNKTTIPSLDTYAPHHPWPAADPDKLDETELLKFSPKSKIVRNLQFWFNISRTPKAQCQYNNARPMLVLRGVSEGEMAKLSRARGPSAKVTLVGMWLTEFLIREQLAGSMGGVGPPIISRLFQFISDGMVSYNHARKIAYVPFPFQHAQLSAIMVVIIIATVPLLIEQFSQDVIIGAFLTLATVVCLAGLHEVARELENPFRNVPNDVPLCTFLAMYNESLITSCSGFHPDSYWEASSSKAEI